MKKKLAPQPKKIPNKCPICSKPQTAYKWDNNRKDYICLECSKK